MLVVGLPALSRPVVSRRCCTGSAPKEPEDYQIKGGVRQRKQRKEEEQRKWELCGDGLEVCGGR